MKTGLGASWKGGKGVISHTQDRSKPELLAVNSKYREIRIGRRKGGAVKVCDSFSDDEAIAWF